MRPIWSWLILASFCLVLSACGDKSKELPKGTAEDNALTGANPGRDLFPPKGVGTKVNQPDAAGAGVAVDPIVVGDCRVTQEVSAQRDGIVKQILVRVGDVVKEGDLLAKLDDRLILEELEVKEARIGKAESELQFTIESLHEAETRFQVEKELMGRGTGKREDYRAAELTVGKYRSEEKGRREEIRAAKAELRQSKIMAEMYAIRAVCPGMIKAIYKQPGEKVQGEKSPEALFQIINLDRLRVEAMVDAQYLDALQLGMPVVIESSMPRKPTQTVKSHMLEVTGVAIAKDGKTLVSGSEDKTLRLWDLTTKREQRVIVHPESVRAVACTSATAERNLCLSGSSDGKGRIWDLDVPDGPPLELQSRGKITCVAFSPDGKSCATGGEDREIRIWNVADGKLLYQLPTRHKAALTALHFTERVQLVSESRESIRTWRLEELKGVPLATLERRSGDVGNLGVSRDGDRVLFDQDKALRILSLPGGLTEAVLQNPSGGGGFATFALFSPDDRLILTAGPSEGRVQVWRAPQPGSRGQEIWQLMPEARAPATCATFSPNGKLAVTGTRDGHVHVWDMPSQEELDRRLTGQIVLVEPDLSSGKQARVWAELPNPDKRLRPGSTVTMVAYPK